MNLGFSDSSYRPTDQRVQTFREDSDPSLVALVFQYGRYLLISSSRPGSQPANLQGIWNSKLLPPWDSKYTTNINVEMNYWPAEVTQLPETVQPLIAMVKDLSETGQSVAREHYNLPGWVTHHNTDLWRAAAPINHANHGIWATGGAWLCQHLW
jgi:alpha-L-fucosidase 2